MEMVEIDKNAILSEYERWKKNAADGDVAAELDAIAEDYGKIEDAFYQELSFGTGGLRGIIGAGTNRMNIYTVAKASQGLADYINKNFLAEERKIAVSYDSRIKSKLFAETAAGVFAANGIEVNIFSELMPTPCLSFAVRYLGCAAGVMITASHNPSKYNGYKVYGPDGCQITVKSAEEIFDAIGKTDVFTDVKSISLERGTQDGIIKTISDDVLADYIKNVKSQTVNKGLTAEEKNIPVIYSPLNGTGLKPVMRALNESGFTNITVVEEQKCPDGNFPTCPYPNPEIKEVFEIPKKYAAQRGAELIIATDPDCDRAGIAVKDKFGKYVLLSGNEAGVLLLDYICSQLTGGNLMPVDPVLVKTIVTTDMAEKVAESYGVRTINVLTGFKFIGEQIGTFEREDKADSYIFGFEESYGYLRGTYVRDKDAVVAATLICEMFAYYKSRGISLTEKLEELYEKFGYYKNSLYSFQFEGSCGFEKMQRIMENFRNENSDISALKIIEKIDYMRGIENLPKSNVLKFFTDGGDSFVVRPSGTEPKLKVYISVSAPNREAAEKKEKEIYESLKLLFV